MTAPASERIHISIFGSRNAGKSTLANELLGQNLSIVSDTKGTTTDPVSKTMELLPLGPVVITDTAGYDDEGELGEKRVLKTKQILNKTDIAIIVINKSVGKTTEDQNFENILKEKGLCSVTNLEPMTMSEPVCVIVFTSCSIYSALC